MTTEEMFQKLSDRLDVVIQRQDEQSKQLKEMRDEITDMKSDITAIKLDIENHVEPMLRDLSGYATSNSSRITLIEGRTETLEDDKEINKVITEIKQKGMM